MSRRFAVGDCVRLPDKRIGRVRGYVDGQVRVRVRLPASETHRFLLYPPARLTRVRCAKGWMSPEGYRRYLRAHAVETPAAPTCLTPAILGPSVTL